jgi:hypothetical protein
MFKRTLTLVGLATAALAWAFVLAPTSSAGSASLQVAIPWHAVDASCPAGYPASTECHARTGGPVAIPGLGFVSTSYVAAVDVAPTGCPAGMLKILTYPAQLIVEGRGAISITVGGSDTCANPGVPVLSVEQAYTITGGTGVFAAATGNGMVSRTDVGCCPGHATDNWAGTISAPGFVQDLTPPTIEGAHKRVVRAPARAKRVRVTYRVTALDAIDGALQPTCRPRSGSRFRVGRRTVVRCSVSDLSANVRQTKFTVDVRRR